MTSRPRDCREAVLTGQTCAEPSKCPCDRPVECSVAGSTDAVYACALDTKQQPPVYFATRGRGERVITTQTRG